MNRTGVNQSPGGGTLYPFAAATALSASVLDFYLSYEDDLCAYVWPFTLTSEEQSILTVKDADGAVVATGDTAAAVSTPWGNRTVYEWVGDTTVMRAVVTTTVTSLPIIAVPVNMLTVLRTVNLDDGVGTLDPRTLNRTPGRVRSIIVGLQTFPGNVLFSAGYNIVLGTTRPSRKDGGRYVNQVNMDATPGAGLGRRPGCEETEPVVRRINGVLPDVGGNFVVEFDDCFRAQPVLETVEEDGVTVARYGGDGLTAAEARAAVRVSSDCRPCYDCSYFVRTYRGLKRVWDRWASAAEAAEAVRDVYESNRRRWTDQLLCRTENPARLVAVSEPNCKGFVGGSYCNTSKCCLAPVRLRFTLQKYKNGSPADWPGEFQMVESYTSGASTDGDSRSAPDVRGPVVGFDLDFADPQTTSMARFRLCVACHADESLKVTFTVHTPDPPEGPSGETCVLPTADVPADVLAVWAANGIDPEADYAARVVLQKVMPFDPVPPSYGCNC